MTPFTKLTQAIIYIHNVSHLLSVVWPLAVLVQGITGTNQGGWVGGWRGQL